MRAAPTCRARPNMPKQFSSAGIKPGRRGTGKRKMGGIYDLRFMIYDLPITLIIAELLNHRSTNHKFINASRFHERSRRCFRMFLPLAQEAFEPLPANPCFNLVPSHLSPRARRAPRAKLPLFQVL